MSCLSAFSTEALSGEASFAPLLRLFIPSHQAASMLNFSIRGLASPLAYRAIPVISSPLRVDALHSGLCVIGGLERLTSAVLSFSF